MSVIFIALPAAVLLAAFAVGAFAWAVWKGQYDDLDTPPLRAVFDEDHGCPSGRQGPLNEPVGAPVPSRPA